MCVPKKTYPQAQRTQSADDDDDNDDSGGNDDDVQARIIFEQTTAAGRGKAFAQTATA